MKYDIAQEIKDVRDVVLLIFFAPTNKEEGYEIYQTISLIYIFLPSDPDQHVGKFDLLYQEWVGGKDQIETPKLKRLLNFSSIILYSFGFDFCKFELILFDIV